MIRKKAAEGQETSYFHSRIFIRLFLSYALIIAVFLALYVGMYLTACSTYYRSAAERETQQKAASWATVMDRQLLAAQSVCAAVNTSENTRSILSTVYVEGHTIDAMQMYRMLNELKRIKGASANMNVYNLMLAFTGDDRVYTGGSVLAVEGESQPLTESPYIGLTTVSRLLGVRNTSAMVMNKEFLIYADDYTAFNSNGAAKGTVLVLFEQSGLKTMTLSALPGMAGARVTCGEDVLLELGGETEHAFAVESMVADGLVYTVYADAKLFAMPLTVSMLLPVGMLGLLGLLFLGATYLFSKRYYRPIDNIGRMVESSREHDTTGQDEIDGILEGVRSLIGERNGYRERMITITPYAKQGMIQSLLSGDIEHQQLEVITDERFVGLRKAFFMLAVVNVAAGEMSVQQYRDAQELIAHACRELSSEEHTVVCCAKNAQNLFVIINSDDGEGMEALFYRMYQTCVEALDDPRYAVTLGVSRLESDIQALRDACADAEQALEQMMTGGRSSVYFHEDAQDKAQRRYFFPRDAHKRIVRGLKEGNLPDLEAMLEEIYRCNAREVELPLSELRLMVEELHVTIRNALRDVFDLSTTHIQIERIREAATLEEIFAYYRTVLATAISRREALPDAGEERALEKALCAYIETSFCDPELSLNAVAERFGVSTKMVGLICKEVYGKTFLQCVRDLQIQHAVSLLQTTENTLEEIALQCGFTNLLTFRRNFKAVMGMNPSDYRK